MKPHNMIIIMTLVFSAKLTESLFKRQVTDSASNTDSVIDEEKRIDNNKVASLSSRKVFVPRIRPTIRTVRLPPVRIPPRGRPSKRLTQPRTSRTNGQKRPQAGPQGGATSRAQGGAPPRPSISNTTRFRNRRNPAPASNTVAKNKSENIKPNTVEHTIIPEMVNNSSPMVSNGAPPEASADKSDGNDEEPNSMAKKSALITGVAISGTAVLIFIFVMVGVMFLRKTETSRSTGSIKKIKAKEQENRRQRLPRMKSVREMRETIFTSFRKVRQNRRTPRT